MNMLKFVHLFTECVILVSHFPSWHVIFLRFRGILFHICCSVSQIVNITSKKQSLNFLGATLRDLWFHSEGPPGMRIQG